MRTFRAQERMDGGGRREGKRVEGVSECPKQELASLAYMYF